MAYRRQSGSGRKLFYGVFIGLAIVILLAMSASALSRWSDGIPVSEWKDAWAFPVLAIMFGGSIVYLSVLFRGPRALAAVGASGARPPAAATGAQVFHGAKGVVAAGLVAMGAVTTLAAGIVINIVASSEGPATAAQIGLMIAVCAAPALGVLWLLRKLFRRPTLTIDNFGIHVRGPGERRVMWSQVTEIRALNQYECEFDPEMDRVDIHVHGATASVRSAPSRRPLFERFRNPTVLKVKSWECYGVSPTAVLDALDRFRPPSVPIHDPRRIVEGDDHRLQAERRNG